MDRQTTALIIVGVVVALMLGIQLSVRLRLRRRRGQMLNGLWSLVQQAAPGQSRVLVYIWSPSCGQCRSTTPIINELQREHANVVSINAAEHTAAVMEAGVMGTPAFLVLDDGVLQQAVLGARSAAAIRKLRPAL